MHLVVPRKLADFALCSQRWLYWLVPLMLVGWLCAYYLRVQMASYELIYIQYERLFFWLEKLLRALAVLSWSITLVALFVSRKTATRVGTAKVLLLVALAGGVLLGAFAISFSSYSAPALDRKAMVNAVGQRLLTCTRIGQPVLPDAQLWQDALDRCNYDKTSYRFTDHLPGQTHVALNKSVSGRQLDELPDDMVVLFEAYGDRNLNAGLELARKQRQTTRYYEEFIFVYLANGHVYPYLFDRDAIADAELGAFRKVQW
jgi:hypothetical protein